MYQSLNFKIQSLGEITTRIWWMSRFKRFFGEGGLPYFSSDDLFTVNPSPSKFILVNQGDGHEAYHVKSDWLLMACSGQTYGLNGAVRLSAENLHETFLSHDLIRIAPDQNKARSGYLQVAMNHPRLGRPLVIRNAYGSSIPHIDPSDASNIPIVRLHAQIEDQIADLAERAADLRSQADILENRMAAEADFLIEAFIAGKDLHSIPLPEDPKGTIAGTVPTAYNVATTETPMTGIEKTSGVNGGDACIAGTRIPVWVLEEMRCQGNTEADILADFPVLTPTKLAQAWAYAQKHRPEIEAALTAHAEA